jgi:catechol 2,3-dioxygenase
LASSPFPNGGPALTRLPDDIRLGAVHLRVADGRAAGAWLERVLGLVPLGEHDGRAAFGSTQGPPLVTLRERKGLRAVPAGGRPGIYHYALLLPDRANLGSFLRHLDELGIEHADSDHLVSEAIYLTDPDGMTVEVYADRPREVWDRHGDTVAMATLPLDHASLLAAAGDARWARMPEGTRMGHVHLYVGDLGAAERFYVEGLGFTVTARAYRGALFVSAGGYHHHVGLNTWAASRTPAGPDDAGLDEWTLRVPDASERVAASQRMGAIGAAAAGPSSWRDPWGNAVRTVGE